MIGALEWFLLGQYFEAVIIAFAAFLLIAGIIVIAEPAARPLLPRIALVLFSTAIIGAAAGYAGGLSRVGVVGEIAGGMLTLLGGLAIYLFGVDQSKGAVVSLAGGCFAFALLAGYIVGAQERGRSELHTMLTDKCIGAYFDGSLFANSIKPGEFKTNMEAICGDMFDQALRAERNIGLPQRTLPPAPAP